MFFQPRQIKVLQQRERVSSIIMRHRLASQVSSLIPVFISPPLIPFIVLSFCHMSNINSIESHNEGYEMEVRIFPCLLVVVTTFRCKKWFVFVIKTKVSRLPMTSSEKVVKHCE